MNLDFNEIANGAQFEDLVVSYFEDLRNEGGHDITNIEIKPSGTGTDGGRDILVTFQISDFLSSFERKWVVQCKFWNADISPAALANDNIPTLLYSYGATGYLLFCKQRPTSKLTQLFERLEVECRLKNKYMIWSGEQFKRVILAKSEPTILRQYFPRYYKYCVDNNLFK